MTARDEAIELCADALRRAYDDHDEDDTSYDSYLAGRILDALLEDGWVIIKTQGEWAGILPVRPTTPT